MKPAADIWFTAVQPFGPEAGARWERYVAWRGWSSPPDLATLDTSLCPTLITELTAEDWDYNVSEDYVVFWFRDLDHLLARTADASARQVLAGWRSPPEHLGGDEIRSALKEDRFAFKGYELLDVHGDISALTNCGNLEQAFRLEELNGAGLLDDVSRAREVQAALRQHYPGMGHEETDVWAVWLMET